MGLGSLAVSHTSIIKVFYLESKSQSLTESRSFPCSVLHFHVQRQHLLFGPPRVHMSGPVCLSSVGQFCDSQGLVVHPARLALNDRASVECFAGQSLASTRLAAHGSGPEGNAQRIGAEIQRTDSSQTPMSWQCLCLAHSHN